MTVGYSGILNLAIRKVLQFSISMLGQVHVCETKSIQYLFKEHQESSVRLIGIDRPGIGLSTFQAGRKILDWPDDVSEFADKLGIDRFCVQGISGGGPYALACAFKIPNRLISCCIISGMSPLYSDTEGMNISNRFVFFIAKWFPWLLRLFLWASIGRFSQFLEKVDALLAKSLSKLPEPDRALLTIPDIRKIFAEVTCEAFLQGSKPSRPCSPAASLALQPE